MMARAITSGIVMWRWGQGREYRNSLMRPEITHSLIKITAELAEILGIVLDEVKEGFTVVFYLSFDAYRFGDARIQSS